MKYCELIPILNDNYVFALFAEDSRNALLVDPGEATVPLRFLRERDLDLADVLITHHHGDHIDGLAGLPTVPTWAPEKNRAQIPYPHQSVRDGDRIRAAGFEFEVWALPGHTLGHVAYWEPQEKWLFSGDVIFGLGCGRLFEGTPDQMWQSLQRIRALPDDTKIFCTHEYTMRNLQFCRAEWPQDEKYIHYESKIFARRKQNRPTVPLLLKTEKILNPFLNSRSASEFKKIRERRNQF